ncbi:MAG: hypothetical protein PHC75_03745 [Burkholderiales bacterium]|nr:hypothetical protein [Burkholderiales bacterium]
MKLNKILITIWALSLTACGFNLRGVDGDYHFPYKNVYLDCNVNAVCPFLKETIVNQNLASIVTNRESAEAIITVSDERTNTENSNFNAVGQISGLKLTYEVTARVYNKSGIQEMPDIIAKSSNTINYNNSLILSASQEEQTTMDELHDNVVRIIIRRIVYSRPYMGSSDVESK